MRSGIYEGQVHHRRRRPVEHRFQYRLFQVLLDLDEMDEVFRGRWFWSTRKPNLAWFRRTDHLEPEAPSLSEAVRELVETRTGHRPDGPIRLLTNLRYCGFAMNPVSFYFCHERDESLSAVVAEVHNTPWNERHCYVLDARGQPQGETFRFTNAKDFHVSPFMTMDSLYRWEVTVPGESVSIAICAHQGGSPLFDAELTLTRREITTGTLAWMLIRFPAMTAQVFGAIYWQALRLWLKGVPGVPHPASLPTANWSDSGTRNNPEESTHT